MGGGHHDHSKPDFIIPDYRYYKVDEKSPELLKVQRALAAQGLKSPWLRNEVWRYNRDINGNRDKLFLFRQFVGRKFWTGLGLAIVTVALDRGYDAVFGNDHGHHGHSEHH